MSASGDVHTVVIIGLLVNHVQIQAVLQNTTAFKTTEESQEEESGMDSLLASPVLLE